MVTLPINRRLLILIFGIFLPLFTTFSQTYTFLTLNDDGNVIETSQTTAKGILTWSSSVAKNIPVSLGWTDATLPSGLDAATCSSQFIEACQTWTGNSSSDNTFNIYQSSDFPVVEISFSSDATQFKETNAGGVTAYAVNNNIFVVNTTSSQTSWESTGILFNKSNSFLSTYQWTPLVTNINQPGGSLISFEYLALHEIGHLLGLGHCYSDNQDLMSPNINPNYGSVPGLSTYDTEALSLLSTQTAGCVTSVGGGVNPPPTNQIILSPPTSEASSTAGYYKINNGYYGVSGSGTFPCAYSLEAVPSPAQNGNATFWSDGFQGSNRTIGSLFPSVTTNVNFKSVHLSNIAFTFSNSQRKLIRTSAKGWLHQVYESMGHVWYEVSKDNGTTWTLMSPTNIVVGGIVQLGNPGPLDIGGGKCPSIAYCPNDQSSVVIVYQQAAEVNYQIMNIIYTMSNSQWIVQTAPEYPIWTEPSTGDSYATNANPTIVWGADGSGLLTWERKSKVSNILPGINYSVEPMKVNGGFGCTTLPNVISLTDKNSTNATSSGIWLPNDSMHYDIAWEQDVNSTKSSIKHSYLMSMMVNGFPSVNPGPVDQLSSNSIGKNYRPSIVTVPDTYGWNNTFCSWIGDLDGSGTWMNVYTYERQEGSSTINRYGVGAQSVSMNMDNGINYYLAWNQNSSYNQSPSSCINYVAGSNLSAKPLNTTGQCVQLSNGATSASMYVSSFYNSALPYYFQTSNSLTSTPQGNVIAQANAVSNTTSVSLSTTVPSGRGRGIAIDKGNTGFYYSIGDINVDGNLIDFASTNKKTKYNNMDTLNNVLLSQPFTIKSNSVLNFSENSGAADTLAAAGILGANGYISFTVQLIDNASGSVLGTVKKVKFSSSNLQLKYKTSPFTLPTTGLGGKTGRLKISVGTNLDSLRLALVEQYAGPGVSVMGQASTLAMQPTSASGITLGSYPNPFNPSTNISYQLIENSRVSIKVYDILGRQITTLVDGKKSAGQYIAVFDGSHYASGVYFVRMMVQGSNSEQIVKTLKIQMLK